MNAAATSKASPITVRSTCRSETKIAAGRHLTDVAGTSATAKQAIAIPSPSTIRIELKFCEPPPPDFEWNDAWDTNGSGRGQDGDGRDCRRRSGVRDLLFLKTAFLCRTFFFGFTCVCTVGCVELELGTTRAGVGA